MMRRFGEVFWCSGAWLAIATNALAQIHDNFDDTELAVRRVAQDVPIDTPDEQVPGPAAEAEQLPSPETEFLPAWIRHGCLNVAGSDASGALAMRLRAGAPSILDVDFDNDGAAEFSFDRSQFDCIVIQTRGGDDQVVIDELNGVFTDTESTTVYGGQGADTLFGGSGGETFIGGPGNDSAFFGAGADRFIWTPGGGSDLIEGAEGIDAVEVNGSAASENFTVTANGARVRFDRLTPSAFFLDIGGCEQLLLNANAGDDTLGCAGNLAALIQISADGGPGDDRLLGSNGADELIGGADNDFIDGNQGADIALMGDGDDTFQWDPGDGSDSVDGQADHDRILFNGSAANEILDFSANGERLRFTRNVGSVVMDAIAVEQFDLNTLGGADIATVGNLTGTDVLQVNVDLAGTLGGSSGDAQADAVSILGTPGSDTFEVSGDDGFVVARFSADVRVKGYEGTDQVVITGVGGDVVQVQGTDEADTVTVTANGAQARVDMSGLSAGVDVSGALSLSISTLGGSDTVACTGNLAALVPITMDGGPGNDTLLGSNGADVLLGGADNDFIDGNQGVDTALMGEGEDTFQWDPGDGNDSVEGQSDHDRIVFNGSNTGEIFDFSANGARLRFTRNIANIVLDAAGVEQFDLRALGGADVANVNELGGTEVIQVNVELAGTLGSASGDAQADSIVVNGSNGSDRVVVAGGITGTLVTGLSAIVIISTAEAVSDRLTVNGLGGDDELEATGLGASVIGLTLSGGPGDDTLLGSSGADLLNGDADHDAILGGGGSDTVQLGSGNDLFIWNPGDDSDVVEGDEGADAVEVNGSGSGEDFSVTANGTRVRFDRVNPTPFFLDLGACEELFLNAHGGNDTLGCTGNLAPLILITADGGPGDDRLLGGNGPDLLLGGGDNDFIDGNQGADIALMGAGDDTFQWDPGDGNDSVEGEADHDEILFNGSSIGEIFELSANGPRLRFTRNIASIVLDADGVEQFDLRALGGTDAITVNDVSGTELLVANVQLAGTPGGSSGDGQADGVTVNGGQGPDTIHTAANAGAVEVSGLAALVRITQSQAASDALTINGLGGVDTITSGSEVAALIGLFVNQ